MAYNSSIEKLTPRHYRILDFAVAGLTSGEIAKNLSMTKAMVSIVMQSPSFQHQFALRRSKLEDKQDEHNANSVDEVKKVLQDSAIDAAKKMIDHVNSPNENISLKSASEILDRAGYPKESKVAQSNEVATQIIINSVDFANLKESLDLDKVVIPDKSANTIPGTIDSSGVDLT